MKRWLLWAGAAAYAAGCARPGVVSRLRATPLMPTLRGVAARVEPYASETPGAPAGSPVLRRARKDLVDAIRRSHLFEAVTEDSDASSPLNVCVLEPAYKSTDIVIDTGLWRNVLGCLFIAGMCLDLKLNQITASDVFEVRVRARQGRPDQVVKTLRFEIDTVYRYPAHTALAGVDLAAVEDEMLLAANRNMAADLVRELSRLLRARPAGAASPPPALPLELKQ